MVLLNPLYRNQRQILQVAGIISQKPDPCLRFSKTKTVDGQFTYGKDRTSLKRYPKIERKFRNPETDE